MADTTIKKWNSTGGTNNEGAWEELYPETTVSQLIATGDRDSTTFLRGDGVFSDTLTGTLTMGSTNVTPAPINIKSNSSNKAIYIEEQGAGTEYFSIGVDTAGNLNFYNSGSTTPYVRFMDDNNVIISNTLSVGALTGSNYNITGVNELQINDPGEGIKFKQGSNGDMTLAIVDDDDDNILRFSGTGARLQVNNYEVTHRNNYDTNFRSEQASDLAVGWYTIATNTGDRAIARFGLRDVDSGRHQAVIFYAAHHFGNDNSNTITVLHNSAFGTTPFRKIRIKDGGTYEGAALQVYIDNAENNVNVVMLGDNFQTSGWVLKDFIADATDPGDLTNYSSMSARGQIDLDDIEQGGIATTGDIYAGGNLTQGKLLTTTGDTMTGDLILEYAFPRIYLKDTDHNNDFSIINANGNFDIYDDTVGTRRLRINSSGNVGIGTTSPSTKLQVYGEISTNYQSDDFNAGGVRTFADMIDASKIARIGTVSGGDTLTGEQGALGLYTRGSERVRISSAGSVGIGTSSPSSKLTVYQSGNGSSNSLIVKDDARQMVIGRDQIEAKDLSNNSATMYINPSANTIISHSSGNVGIGTTSPHTKLTTKVSNSAFGNVTTNTNSQVRVGQYVDSGGAGRLYLYDGNGNNDVLINTNGTSHFNGGNVGIGTSSPSEKLDVQGTVKITSNDAAQLILYGDSNNSEDTGQTDAIIDFLHDGGSFGYRLAVQNYGGYQTFNLLNKAGSTYSSRLFVDGDGNLGIGTTNPDSKFHINATGRAMTVGGNPTGDPASSVATQTSYLELVAGSGSATSSSGLIFHNPGISTSVLEYVNTDANNAYFNFRSDDTNWDLRVNGNAVETEEFASSYTTIASNGWNDYALGRGIFSTSSSSGLPSGATHGYWLTLGRRDVLGGYAGIYVNSYQTAGSGVYIGRHESGGNPTWEKVWTDKTDGSGSTLDADLLDGNHASAFATAGHTHTNLVSVSGDSMTGDLQLDKDGTTDVGSHGIVFQANTTLDSIGDFTRELNIDSTGNLQYNGNIIFHEGNDGSASGLHADLLDGQQGSYYLDYNNFTNTPSSGGVTSIKNFTNYVASAGTSQRQLNLTKSLSIGDKIGLVVQTGSTSNYGTRSQEIIWVEVGTSSHTVQTSYYITSTTTARWYAFEVYITTSGALYIDDAVAWTNGSFGHSGSNSSAIYILDVLELA